MKLPEPQIMGDKNFHEFMMVYYAKLGLTSFTELHGGIFRKLYCMMHKDEVTEDGQRKRVKK